MKIERIEARIEKTIEMCIAEIQQPSHARKAQHNPSAQRTSRHENTSHDEMVMVDAQLPVQWGSHSIPFVVPIPLYYSF